MDKVAKRIRRKKTIRKKISGTTDRPRMCVHRSNKNLNIQIVDDLEGKTLCNVNTSNLEDANKKDTKTRKNLIFAKAAGETIAKIAVEKGIKKIVFDRSGYRYHGAIKAIAEAARENGLEF